MDAEAEREFREFVAARSAALFRSAYLLTGQREAAEDLLQTVLARVARRWKRIDGAPEAYVRRALYHEQVASWRRRRWAVSDGAVPDVAAPGDHAAVTDLRLALAAALRTLTPRQRAIVVLRYVEDLPESEVAAVLEVSVGTVRSTAYRALARLRTSCPELVIPEEAR
jgi:RNA polymerase sigma-70 factor (sigma-E family)